ncbi:gamma-glutamyl-gamma-aminobutyrate hydrolase family protein [Marivita hallyeonensis]|uniref:Putative glutamine amidotransferase n=1 Tax=Marivita hallyeonensis TaxID=996342 RepID=A0A1M5MNH9_9RHOB|nr:gamma-glutamyl-gamma-aminobutyrate hydrolase family protein [Marivita hallyeonensis]SHG78821.1 putative glutamine amidotransferase [Marivita hallyeonensis]
MTRPVIGVSTSERTGWRVFPLINLNLWLVGARGVRWGSKREYDLDQVDGVIIGGGDDIAPELYGGRQGVSVRLDRERDAFERRVAEEALFRNIPVLGICRGAQMLNVALGGTLDQNAWQTYGMHKKITTILPKREVCVKPDTHLGRHAGEEPMMVNALHSQAVERLGNGLRMSAHDTSGMVQAIERVQDPFAMGVQWHPEHLFYARRQRAIFRALKTASLAYRQERCQTDAVKNDVLPDHSAA